MHRACRRMMTAEMAELSAKSTAAADTVDIKGRNVSLGSGRRKMTMLVFVAPGRLGLRLVDAGGAFDSAQRAKHLEVVLDQLRARALMVTPTMSAGTRSRISPTSSLRTSPSGTRSPPRRTLCS